MLDFFFYCALLQLAGVNLLILDFHLSLVA